jgi:hypothetical protein
VAAAGALVAGGALYLAGLYRLRRVLQLDAFMAMRRQSGRAKAKTA